MKSQVDKDLSRFMSAPLVKWPEMMAKMDHSARLEMSRAASSDIERLTLLSEYAETCDSPECHEYALTKAQRMVAKVRKALGFTYPKQGLAEVRF